MNNKKNNTNMKNTNNNNNNNKTCTIIKKCNYQPNMNYFNFNEYECCTSTFEIPEHNGTPPLLPVPGAKVV